MTDSPEPTTISWEFDADGFVFTGSDAHRGLSEEEAASISEDDLRFLVHRWIRSVEALDFDGSATEYAVTLWRERHST